MTSWSFDAPVDYYVAVRYPSAVPSRKQPVTNGVPRKTAQPLSPPFPGSPAHSSETFYDARFRSRIRMKTVGGEPAALRRLPSIGNLIGTHDPERELREGWSPGQISITLRGGGGRDGGELRILRTAKRGVAFTYAIPTVDEDDGWTIPDIQFVHPSVAGRQYAIALQLPLSSVLTSAAEAQSPPPPMPRILADMSRTMQENAILSASPPFPFLVPPSSLHNRRPSRSKQPSSGICPAVAGPKAAHGKTVSSPAQMEGRGSHGAEWDNATQLKLSSVSEGVAVASRQDVFVYVAFKSCHDRDEWFSLFRSLARIEPQRITRSHRRLKVGVLDIQETQAPPVSDGLDGSSKHDNDSFGSDGIFSQIGSPGRHSKGPWDSSSATPRRPANVRPGWSQRDRIQAEMLLDNRLFARTGWAYAAEGSTPYWGEHFSFNEIPPADKCRLVLFRLSKSDKRPVPFGTVDVPLIASFSKVTDERFPVRSLVNASLIGEIRLVVSYQEIDVVDRVEYDALNLAHASEGSKFLYIMSGRGLMEGTMEYLAKIGLCLDVFLARAIDTCTIEAKASGNTLFRSNTPLSKTLEILMRLMCSEFLEASIKPTIDRVIRENIQGNLFLIREGAQVVNQHYFRIVTEVVECCWGNMYIRYVFEHLFRMVKKYHDFQNDLLRYKAISSFIFLRLIGPAMMTPHLFGLANGMPPVEVQKTLTLIAKVLHALAFFMDRDQARHPDLALFQPFVKKNAEAMLDYLTNMVTPVTEYPPRKPPPTELDNFIAQRKLHLDCLEADAIPCITPAGPIDLGAEWAVCAESWYERRTTPGSGLTMTAQGLDKDPNVLEMVAKYDAFLDRIHDLATNKSEDEDSEDDNVELDMGLLMSASPRGPVKGGSFSVQSPSLVNCVENNSNFPDSPGNGSLPSSLRCAPSVQSFVQSDTVSIDVDPQDLHSSARKWLGLQPEVSEHRIEGSVEQSPGRVPSSLGKAWPSSRLNRPRRATSPAVALSEDPAPAGPSSRRRPSLSLGHSTSTTSTQSPALDRPRTPAPLVLNSPSSSVKSSKRSTTQVIQVISNKPSEGRMSNGCRSPIQGPLPSSRGDDDSSTSNSADVPIAKSLPSRFMAIPPPLNLGKSSRKAMPSVSSPQPHGSAAIQELAARVAQNLSSQSSSSQTSQERGRSRQEPQPQSPPIRKRRPTMIASRFISKVLAGREPSPSPLDLSAANISLPSTRIDHIHDIL